MKKIAILLFVFFSFSIAAAYEEQLVFFDTPELFLLKNGGSLVYTKKEYLSKKGKLKYNEEIKLNYEQINMIFPVKHYKNSEALEGKHPLFSLVKRKERQTLISELENLGIKYPLSVKEVFTVSKTIDSNSSNSKNMYATYYNHLNSKVNFLNFRLKYPELVNLIYILFMGAVSIFTVWLLFRKRLRKSGIE